MIQFDKNGLVKVADADAQLQENAEQLEAIGYGFETIGDLLEENEGTLAYNIDPYSQCKLSLVDIDGERMLRHTTTINFQPTLSLTRNILATITFENGYANPDKANEELKGADLQTDIFEHTGIENLLASGIIFSCLDENKNQVRLLLEEVEGKMMLKKEITEPTPPEGFNPEKVRKEIVKILKAMPDKSISLSDLGTRIKELNIKFSTTYKIGYFLSKNSDIFERSNVNGTDICTLKRTPVIVHKPDDITTPIENNNNKPKSDDTKTEPIYTLFQNIAINDKKGFYPRLAELAKEDDYWIYMGDISNPYRFLAARVDLMLARALKNQDTNILKSDFFGGTLDTGLTSKDDKKILIRFARNNCPDKDTPQPWKFVDFELV